VCWHTHCSIREAYGNTNTPDSISQRTDTIFLRALPLFPGGALECGGLSNPLHVRYEQLFLQKMGAVPLCCMMAVGDPNRGGQNVAGWGHCLYNQQQSMYTEKSEDRQYEKSMYHVKFDNGLRDICRR